ncbi:uncharacterized protein BYT42DRAFT_56090 [Radiomyces spectabilis]|uniref:uncharacterized protein n=1 Tax=Radiomyces spectabilis TaxID=64574 RepID=UPI0022209C10|nr:uncharacterized protein BYT42DRAFT_56090 [Radiomyces spectabilis]KAI8373030.1 hypothetical protein BYT42DRAFT_56090 [Radiomyces spectabilis]
MTTNRDKAFFFFFNCERPIFNFFFCPFFLFFYIPFYFPYPYFFSFSYFSFLYLPPNIPSFINLVELMTHHHDFNSSPSATAGRDLASLLPNYKHEVPATAPVFEGHLYLRTDKKQWQWRLFRFDGTSFTCLSSRKVKLPPNTAVDAPLDTDFQLSFIHSSPSFATSLTSPLLATPKDKTLRLTSSANPNADAGASPPVLASYYQLPKWTVDIANISAVSVLKPAKQPSITLKSPFSSSSSSSKSRCFCVRTFDGQCYIMKAQKQKDLERWLFVLTKMWKFAQAIRQQVITQQQQQQQQQQHQHQHQQHHQAPQPSPIQPLSQLALSHSLSQPHPPLHAGGLPQQQQQQSPHPRTTPMMYPSYSNYPVGPPEPHDTMPLFQKIPPTPSPMHDSSSYHPPSSSFPRPHPPIHDDRPEAPSSQYEKRYHAPTLSVEKMKWISEWRSSLAELMACDPNIRVSPPPIEPIPEDDKMSVWSDMTSVSHRDKPRLMTPKRRGTWGSRRSIRVTNQKRGGSPPTATHTNSTAAQRPGSITQEASLKCDESHSPSLRKKRSDDVKHWIEPSSRVTPPTAVASDQPEALNEQPDDMISSGLRKSGSQQSVHLVRSGSNRKPMIQRISVGLPPACGSSSPEIYHIDYFQDVRTIGEEDDDTETESQHERYCSKMRYHSSVRAKNIQVVNNSQDPTWAPPQAGMNSDPSMNNNDSPSLSHRGLSINRRASMPLEAELYSYQSLWVSPPLDAGPLHGMSPLQSLAKADSTLMSHKRQDSSNAKNDSGHHASAAVDHDEEISLADLQKALKQVSGEAWRHTRSPSASSAKELEKQHERQQQQGFSLHSRYPMPPYVPLQSSSYAAPAIPPVHVHHKHSASLSGFYPRGYPNTPTPPMLASTLEKTAADSTPLPYQPPKSAWKLDDYAPNTWPSRVPGKEPFLPHRNKTRPQSMMMMMGPSGATSTEKDSMDPSRYLAVGRRSMDLHSESQRYGPRQ